MILAPVGKPWTRVDRGHRKALGTSTLAEHSCQYSRADPVARQVDACESAQKDTGPAAAEVETNPRKAIEVCGLTADGASAVQVATGGDSDAGPVLGLLATPAKPTAAAVSKDAEYDKACAAELTLPDNSWLWDPRMDEARVKLTKLMTDMSECEESQRYLQEFLNTLANLKPGCLDTISGYHPFPKQSAFWQLCAENAKWENLSVQLQEAINEVASLGCRLQGEYLMFAGPPLLATPAKPTAAAAVSEDAASEDAAYDKACEAEDDDDEWGTEGVDWHWTGQGCFRFDRFDLYMNRIWITQYDFYSIFVDSNPFDVKSLGFPCSHSIHIFTAGEEGGEEEEPVEPSPKDCDGDSTTEEWGTREPLDVQTAALAGVHFRHIHRNQSSYEYNVPGVSQGSNMCDIAALLGCAYYLKNPGKITEMMRSDDWMLFLLGAGSKLKHQWDQLPKPIEDPGGYVRPEEVRMELDREDSALGSDWDVLREMFQRATLEIIAYDMVLMETLSVVEADAETFTVPGLCYIIGCAGKHSGLYMAKNGCVHCDTHARRFMGDFADFGVGTSLMVQAESLSSLGPIMARGSRYLENGTLIDFPPDGAYKLSHHAEAWRIKSNLPLEWPLLVWPPMRKSDPGVFLASEPAPSEPPTPRMCLSANSEPCEVPAEGPAGDACGVPRMCLSANSEPCEVTAEGPDKDSGDAGDGDAADLLDEEKKEKAGRKRRKLNGSKHVPSSPVATPARQHGTLRKEKFRTFSAEEKASAQPWLVTCIELAELNTNVSGGLNN